MNTTEKKNKQKQTKINFKVLNKEVSNISKGNYISSGLFIYTQFEIFESS